MLWLSGCERRTQKLTKQNRDKRAYNQWYKWAWEFSWVTIATMLF